MSKKILKNLNKEEVGYRVRFLREEKGTPEYEVTKYFFICKEIKTESFSKEKQEDHQDFTKTYILVRKKESPGWNTAENKIYETKNFKDFAKSKYKEDEYIDVFLDENEAKKFAYDNRFSYEFDSIVKELKEVQEEKEKIEVIENRLKKAYSEISKKLGLKNETLAEKIASILEKK